MNYHALDIQESRLKHRPWGQKLIPKKLEELAKAGIYYDDKVL